MASHRGNGEGSIYQRSSDKRWVGAVSIGFNPKSKPVRKVVTAKTRGEVVHKLKQLQRNLDDGLPPPGSSLSVAQLLDRWFNDVLRHQVAPSAAKNYKSIADNHIVPLLGRKKWRT